MIEIILPDIGEGIETVSVTEILIKENQKVKINDSILLVETDKASMEIPINKSGTIEKILIKVGDLISPGQTICKISEINDGTQNPINHNIEQIDDKIKLEENNDLNDEISNKKIVANVQSHASPSIKKLARELNCNLAQIKGTGKNNRITKDDLYNSLKKNFPINVSHPKDNDNFIESLSKWGLVEKKEFNSIQSVTSKRLVNAWSSIPHVTQFDEVDVTELYKIMNLLKTINTSNDVKISFIPFFIKAVCNILIDIPIFNTSLNSDNQSFIQKHYYNIGVAVDTSKGLLVPVIKDVDKKSVKSITAELSGLITKSKKGKLTLEEMSGGCFTISSLGNLGGKFFTPIINPPEVSILGISSIDIKPIYTNKKFRARKILPISLSYDHRIINGADAVKFTTQFADYISNPAKL